MLDGGGAEGGEWEGTRKSTVEKKGKFGVPFVAQWLTNPTREGGYGAESTRALHFRPPLWGGQGPSNLGGIGRRQEGEGHGVPIVAQWKQTRLASMRTWV